MRRPRSYFSNWRNWLGVLLCLLFVSVALAAPLLSPQDPKEPGPFKHVGRITDWTPHAPSPAAILGTAPQQLDVFHTLVWGTRQALQFGLIVVLVSFSFGVFYGALAGSAGGMINGAMMRVADALLSFPILAGVVFLQQLVSVTVTSLSGNTAIFDIWKAGTPVIGATPFTIFFSQVDPLMISLILLSWMSYARLTNTRVITIRQDEFVQAARALGAGDLWVVFKHLIPNSIGSSIVLASRDLGNVVILQATISFLRLGSNSPWGIMLSDGRDWVIGPGGNILAYWWLYIPITLVVILFGISWNLLGDGFNEILNPNRPGAAGNPGQ